MQTYRLALDVTRYCWVTFMVIWFLAAFWTKQSVYQESAARRLRYVVPLLLGGWMLRGLKGDTLFDSKTNVPKVTPQVLSAAERNAIRDP